MCALSIFHWETKRAILTISILLDFTDNVVEIDGENHAQFGNYGRLKGNPEATISAEQQQGITAKPLMQHGFHVVDVGVLTDVQHGIFGADMKVNIDGCFKNNTV